MKYKNKEYLSQSSEIISPQVVLFTGGRDSSLTAGLLMMKGIPVCLLSANSGASVHSKIRDRRVKELTKRFGNKLLIDYQTLDVAGSFREVALAEIETDILTDKKNLIVLGEKIAILSHAINFCIRNKYRVINVGYTKYQEEFPEQRNTSINLFKSFLMEYGVSLACPIYNDASSIEYVKYKLMQIGLSNKPLEGSTLFGDTFSKASDEIIKSYIDRKLLIARDIVKFLYQHEISKGI